MIKAILKTKVAGLGQAGEVVKVKEGYLRNYLLPNDLATEATPVNLKHSQQLKQKIEVSKKNEKEQALKLADRIKNVSLTLKKEATDQDILYGSVSKEDIKAAFNEEGHEIVLEALQIEEPIKKLGIYYVDINLHPEVKAKVKIWVVKK